VHLKEATSVPCQAKRSHQHEIDRERVNVLHIIRYWA